MDTSRTAESVSQKSTTLRLAGILLLAVIFRLFLLRYRWAVGFDEPHYLRLAAAGVTEGWRHMLHPYWPPMYPAFIALFSFFVKDFELAGRLVSVVSGTLIILPIYFLARDLYGRQIALISSLLLALFPLLAFTATNAMSESLYTFLATSGMAFGWFALKRKSWPRAALSGLLFGAAYLAKPEGVGYLLVFVAFAGAAFIFSRKYRQRYTLISIAASIMGFVIIAAQYFVYLREEMGGWSLSMKFQANQQFAALGWTVDKAPNFKEMLSEDNRFLPTDLAWHTGNFQIISKEENGAASGSIVNIDVGLITRKFAENFYRVNQSGVPAFLTLAPLVLMTLGLFRERWTVQELPEQLYLISFIAFFWFILVPLFHVNLRYFAPLLPICFIWIAKGFLGISEWADGTLRGIRTATPECLEHNTKRSAVLLVLAFVLVFSYLPELGKIVARHEQDTDYWADAVELEKAGQWLKANTTGAPVLMSYNKAVDFYSGGTDLRKGASFPLNDDFNRILAYARYRNVEYMVVSERYKSTFPNLRFLVEGKDVPSDLELVYKESEPNKIRTVIYKLRPPKL